MANNGQEKSELFKPKLTEDQKKSIFAEYVSLHTKKEQRNFAKEKARELGVSDDTIGRVLNDRRRWDRYVKAMENEKMRELARAHAHLGDALDVQLSVIRNRDKYEGGGLIQYPMQAAVDLMNRLGFKAETKEAEGVNITFIGGGAPVTNMPERKDEAE